MDRHQRLHKILHELEKNKTLVVEEVGEMLSISPATVRRDFNYLAEHYQVEKTWGGISMSNAVKIPDSMVPLQQRRTKNVNAKRRIAKKAASFVQDGEIIFIDGGTTTSEMVPHLVNKKLKIITNSILIAQQVDMLKPRFPSEVFVSGGLLYPESGLVVGPQALRFIEGFNADWTFLSVGGITKHGATNSNILVVETEKAMIERSERTVVLADSSKFGKKDLVEICDLDKVDFLISETGDKDDFLHSLSDAKIQVISV